MVWWISRRISTRGIPARKSCRLRFFGSRTRKARNPCGLSSSSSARTSCFVLCLIWNSHIVLNRFRRTKSNFSLNVSLMQVSLTSFFFSADLILLLRLRWFQNSSQSSVCSHPPNWTSRCALLYSSGSPLDDLMVPKD